MGVDGMRISVQLRKIVFMSIRIGYKSVCKHPFLAGTVCFLSFLYRSFPFLFSVLVSASPVLVCTALLLGTLLSFGEPMIPEILKEEEEEEEEVSHEISSFKPRVVEDSTVVVGKGEGFGVEKIVGNTWDMVDRSIEEENFVENQVRRAKVNDGLGEYMPLIDESSHEVQFEKQVIEGVESDFDGLKLDKRKEVDEEPGGEAVFISEKDHQSPGEFIEAQKNGHLNFSGDSSWRQGEDDYQENEEEEEKAEQGNDREDDDDDDDDDDDEDEEEEEEEEEEEGSDSGSDRAESSSPDASMADILPMLDELHPLLEDEAPHPAQMSRIESDSGSERFHGSKMGCVELDNDVESEADGEEGDAEDDENDEEEEEARGDKEDESKSAIKWTEDDQKNLMDLGTLEIERNQRLESLIARRRARRNMRLMAEKNLIDLDGDLPINIPPISTGRRNPFDLPFDAYDDVPGSAPSVLLPRRNPFDLPYDSSEEKPDLKGDSFQQEFSVPQHKEPMFRRHESFSVGSSVFGGSKLERHDFRWKPYFVPERFAGEGTSSHTFQRQSSEASESKLSSVPDTESVKSDVDEDDKKLNDEVLQEAEMISSLDNSSLLVERGSLSSEDERDLLDSERVGQSDVHHDEVEITLGEVENEREINSEGTTPVGVNATEILMRMGPGEDDYSSRSSVSSLSDIEEDSRNLQKVTSGMEASSSHFEESHISTQTSVESDSHAFGSLKDDYQLREPISDPAVGDSFILKQTSVDSEYLFTSGVLDDNHHKESVSMPRDHVGETGPSTLVLHDLDFHFPGADASQQEDGVSESIAVCNQHGEGVSESADGDQHGEGVSESGDGNQHREVVAEPMVDHIANKVVNDNQHLESGNSTQSSVRSANHLISVTVNDSQHREPVYDSSPQSVDRYLSFSSVSSDTLGEVVEMGSPLAAFQVADNVEHEVHSDNSLKDVAGGTEITEGRSRLGMLDGNDSSSTEHTGITVLDVSNAEYSGSNPITVDQSEVVKSESTVEHNKNVLVSSSEDISRPENVVQIEKSFREQNLLESYATDREIDVTVLQNMEEGLNSVSWGEEMGLPVVQEFPPSVVTENVQDSKFSSSGTRVVEEHATDVKEIQLEHEPVHLSSVDNEIHVDRCQTFSENLESVASSPNHISSGNLSLSLLEERELGELSDQVLDAHPDNQTTSNVNCIVERPLVDEEIHQSHLDQSYSSISDVTGDTGPAQFVDMEVISTESDNKYEPSEKKYPVPLEKQLSWMDKSVIEPPVNNSKETMKSSTSMTEAIDGVSIIDDPSVMEASSNSAFTVSPASPEYKTPAAGLHLKDDLFDKIVYEDSVHALENSNYSTDAYGSPIGGESIMEEVGELKDIDGLLSELDTVGDFSVKEVDESFHCEQMQRETNARSLESDLPENTSSPRESMLELPVLEVRSPEDIHLAFKQINEGVDIEEVIVPSMFDNQHIQNESDGPREINSDLQDVEAMDVIHVAGEIRPELPILEVRSLEDINLAFKQIHEGVHVEEVIVPSMISDELVADKCEGPSGTNLNMQVVEARSLDDIHLALKKVSEEGMEAIVQPTNLENEHAEIKPIIHEAEAHSGVADVDLQTVEPRSLVNTDVTMKSVSEENIEGTAESSDFVIEHAQEKVVIDETDLDMQALEPRSLDGIDVSLKQVSSGHIDGKSEFKNEDAEVKQVVSEAEVLPVEAVQDLEAVELRNLGNKHVETKQVLEENSGSVTESSGSKNEHVEVKQVINEAETPPEEELALQAVEMRSSEDVHVPLKQNSENTDKIAESSGSKVKLMWHPTEQLPVLEVRSIEDIDLAFKQLHEGVDVDDIIVPSTIERHTTVDRSEDPSQTISALPVVEAGSLEDIQVAMKQVLAGEIEEPPKPSNPKVVVENEGQSALEPEPSIVEVMGAGSGNERK